MRITDAVVAKVDEVAERLLDAGDVDEKAIRTAHAQVTKLSARAQKLLAAKS